MTKLSDSYIKEKFPFREFRNYKIFDRQEIFFKRVAMTYDNLDHAPHNPRVKAAYDAFKEEIFMQFEYMVSRDIQVKPSLTAGQPYRSSTEMMKNVALTDTLYVYMTKTGYGTGHQPALDHPMLENSGVEIDGYQFCFNDLFRAVHDYYCHYLFKNDFSITGECMAASMHLNLLSHLAGSAAFTETIGQICWFYYGAHLFDESLNLPVHGSKEYLPLGSRPYPMQKAMLLPQCLMEKFHENVS